MRTLTVLDKDFHLCDEDVSLLYKLEIVYDCDDGHDLHLDPCTDMNLMYVHGTDHTPYLELLLECIHRGFGEFHKLY